MDAIKNVAPFLDMENGPWVAGGAVRRILDGSPMSPTADIDIFCQNELTYLGVISHIKKSSNRRYVYKYETEGQISTMIKIHDAMANVYYNFQICKFGYHSSLENLLNDMDFTVCMFGTDGKTIVGDPQGIIDLKFRVLNLRKIPTSPAPGRLMKYCNYGFVPNVGVLSQILATDKETFSVLNRVEIPY